MDPSPIIYLSGPIGAGKTAVAKELVTLLPGRVALIEGDTFWFHLAKIDPSRPRQRDFRMIMTAMAAAAMPYALNGYTTVIDFSTPPWFLPVAGKLLARRKVPLDYVVLLPPQEVCARRAASRAEGKIEDYSVGEELYKEFLEHSLSVAPGDLGPGELAGLIAEELADGRFRISP